MPYCLNQHKLAAASALLLVACAVLPVYSADGTVGGSSATNGVTVTALGKSGKAEIRAESGSASDESLTIEVDSISEKDGASDVGCQLNSLANTNFAWGAQATGTCNGIDATIITGEATNICGNMDLELKICVFTTTGTVEVKSADNSATLTQEITTGNVEMFQTITTWEPTKTTNTLEFTWLVKGKGGKEADSTSSQTSGGNKVKLESVQVPGGTFTFNDQYVVNSNAQQLESGPTVTTNNKKTTIVTVFGTNGQAGAQNIVYDPTVSLSSSAAAVVVSLLFTTSLVALSILL